MQTITNKLETSKLDPNTQKRLADMAAQLDRQLEKKSNNSELSYLKFEDGDNHRLLFLPEYTEQVDVVYQQGEPAVPRIKFVVKDLDKNNNPITNNELEWTTSLTTGRDVLRWLNNNIFILNVTRKGEKLNTKYEIFMPTA